ncbi:hypothetical protein D187_009243 [Cystobacter fuscus DSM 2262]|uniref:Uncharacterized protein n=1 Tax=Cystobacter fuscus (strain ATCC 25194 / DSM 2262 / NBRC 100088 / M29) TaxID=1242864 RepID=S9P069_CYSF2|nr:hypothetical protein D187_009243 [Cystobacter fuscus DSM 2262]
MDAGLGCGEASLVLESAAPPHAVRDSMAANNAGRAAAGGGRARFLSLPADEARVFISFSPQMECSGAAHSF